MKNNNDEIWMTLKDFPNYEISTAGQVKSYIHKKPVILSQYINKAGYATICLTYMGKRYFRYVHRLVAQTFIPNPENFSQINHINEVKCDNRINNIEWCTPYYNTHYGSRNERIGLSSTGRKRQKHSILQLTKNDEVVNMFSSAGEAERKTGFHHSSILKCCKGEVHSVGGFKWKYCDNVEYASA